ncbi:hypothetical protein ABIB75_001075 [Bradyrhizobium sp. GM2.2]|uniref:hypothetical protein n=1 Tax=unclassified Bradyrhizobium TaxID=2631580 RepID=UPI001FFBBF53|nr:MULTISPECIES: hypothetical protein [unclassified Bradyrhizobium]MCK1540343.1 hypothetical protein [Bradyrhizobium sp. 176]MCK1556185.1 hypothetical protein [Bradyrhizobium sp. 171]
MKSAAEIDRVVAAIDETRRAEHWRSPDRPDANVFKLRERVPPEVTRAQGRLRTAHWRVKMDSRRAPDSREIGMSLVHALITTKLTAMTWTDKDLVARMLMDLQARGYDVNEAKATLRRMRNRYVDPADRAAEPSESCAAPISLAGEPEDDLPF